MGVAEYVRSNPDIDQLLIAGFWFEDNDAEELAAALAHNTSLKSLALYGCMGVGGRGLRCITEALKTNTVIDRLTLHFFQIGDAGAEVLADLLVSTSSLLQIAIESCGVGETGARTIADALKINTTLQVFNMSYNKIGDAGAVALAGALAVNSSLKELYAFSCGIGAVGSRAIADALNINPSHQILNLGDNKIGDAGAAALAVALATTTSLTRLYLHNCGIGEQGALALGRALGSNLALSIDFRLDTSPKTGDTRDEAVRVRASVLRRRELLLAFGMAMLERLGGGTDEKARSTRSSTRRSTFHGMNKDVFKLVGEAYGEY
jgi:Ran GTPase-activating protein (RanGAP) involved in mRNA processing and transport